MQSKSYFDLIENPCTGKQALDQRVRNADSDVAKRFFEINRIDPKTQLSMGTIIQTPSLSDFHPAHLGAFQSVTDQSNYNSRNGQYRPQPQIFNQRFDLLKYVGSDFFDSAGDHFGGIDDYVNQRIINIKSTLEDLNKHYMDAKQSRVPLNARSMINGRKIIENRLNEQLTGLSRKAILRNASAPSMKDALTISHNSIKKWYKTTPNATHVKQIAKAISKTDDLSKTLGKIGTVGKALTFGSKAMNVYSAFKNDGQSAGVKSLGKESSSFLGGLAGGAAGAKLGAVLATGAVVALGVGTGGTGFIVIGLCAAAGGYLGGEGGEALAEGGFEWLHQTSVD